MLSTGVSWHASKEEEGESVGELVLTLNDTLSKVVVPSNTGTLIGGVAQAVQGAGVSSVHYQQLNLHALSGECCNVQGGRATLWVHVVGVCPMDNETETGLKVVGPSTRMELLEGKGGKGRGGEEDRGQGCVGEGGGRREKDVEGREE